MEEKINLIEKNKLHWAELVDQISKDDYYRKYLELGYDKTEAERLAKFAYKGNKLEAKKIVENSDENSSTQHKLLSQIKHLFGKRKQKLEELENNN